MNRTIPIEKQTTAQAVAAQAWPGWAILPLRLFLGISFLAAGYDKLSDPAFLNPAARDNIGQQIARMAPGTPLEGFLQAVALPNAQLFGIMVMGGELCIGAAVLLGLLTRFSAAMGLLLNLTFFLSATWDVRPFYFGADLPYVFGWLTLLLAGPGPLAVDHWVRRWLDPRVELPTAAPLSPEALVTRRAFLTASAAGLAGIILAGTGLGWGLLHPRGATPVAGGTPSLLPPTPTAPALALAPPTDTAAPARPPADIPAPEAPPPTRLCRPSRRPPRPRPRTSAS